MTNESARTASFDPDAEALTEIETRRRFEAIVAGADDGVVVLEPNSVIGYANDAAEFLLGRGRDELVGEMFGLPAAPIDGPISVNVVSRDGMLRLVELRIEPLPGGPPGTLVLRLKDVTLHDRRVRLAREETRRRDEFLAMLSHELRNPLAAIRGASLLLALDDLDPPSRREASGVLDRQFGHLTRILDDLLDLTRILQGKLVLRATRTDLAQALLDAVEAVASSADRRNQSLHVDLPPRTLYVDGDATRLEQIVVNLLNNAVKFTPPGGNVWLSAAVVGEQVEVRVRDDGPGIPAELLPSVFEPFVQGIQTLERSEGGLGIGLMLVRNFLALHGGSIEAIPHEDDPGVTFAFRLPLVGEETRDLAFSPDQAPTADSSSRVLIVEDNDDARRMFARLLRRQGHEAIEAASGPDGLAAALAHRPDVAFVDIGLPGMDGYELARRLRREAGSYCPRLVALTGYGTPEDVRRSDEAGFDEHLVKPVLLADVRRILQSFTEDGTARNRERPDELGDRPEPR